MDKLLYLLEKNPRLTNAELAVMLGLTEEEVAAKVCMYEDSGVIKGYRALIDKEKAHAQTVTALIELKVQPKFGHGFDEVANRIAKLDEVESVYLISGGYDLCCIVEDKSFEEVQCLLLKDFLRLRMLFLPLQTLFLKNIRSREYCSPKSKRMTGGQSHCDKLR